MVYTTTLKILKKITMKNILILLFSFCFFQVAFTQTTPDFPKTEILVLGTHHLAQIEGFEQVMLDKVHE